MVIPIIKIRRSHDSLIFLMGYLPGNVVFILKDPGGPDLDFLTGHFWAARLESLLIVEGMLP